MFFFLPRGSIFGRDPELFVLYTRRRVCLSFVIFYHPLAEVAYGTIRSGITSLVRLLWARAGRRPSEIFAEQTAIEASSLQSEDGEETDEKWEEVLGG